jgi:hypothetical protein
VGGRSAFIHDPRPPTGFVFGTNAGEQKDRALVRNHPHDGTSFELIPPSEGVEELILP